MRYHLSDVMDGLVEPEPVARIKGRRSDYPEPPIEQTRRGLEIVRHRAVDREEWRDTLYAIWDGHGEAGLELAQEFSRHGGDGYDPEKWPDEYFGLVASGRAHPNPISYGSFAKWVDEAYGSREWRREWLPKSKQAHPGVDPADWPLSLPPIETPAPPDIDPAVLGDVLGPMASEISRVLKVPTTMAALGALVAASMVTMRRFRLEVHPGWRESLVLWAWVASPSGSRKSAVVELCFAAIKTWEQAEHIKWKQAKAEADVRKAVAEARAKALRKEAENADDPAERNRLIKLATDAAEEATAECACPTLLAEDATPEAVVEKAARNDGCVGFVCDEAVGILTALLNQYAKEVNASWALKGFTGSDYRSARLGRGETYVPSLQVAMYMLVQAGAVKDLTGGAKFRDNGLIGRALLAVLPSSVGFRTLEQSAVDSTVEQRYADTLKGILDLPEHRDEHGRLLLETLKIESRAYEAFREFWEANEAKMRDGGTLSSFGDWGSKFPGTIARIAAILHVVRSWREGAERFEVGLADMQSAIALAGPLQALFLHGMDALGADDDTAAARAIWGVVQGYGLTEFSGRDVHQKLRDQVRFKHAASLIGGFETLVELGYLRAEGWTRRDKIPRHLTTNPHLASSDQTSV